jgi:hypothetical protein
MRAIKGIVIGMGVLILAGFIVVVVALIVRMQGAGTPKGVFQNSVSLPAGATVIDMQMADGDIALWVEEKDGTGWVVLVSTATGVEKGRIRLLPSPPP